MSEFPVTVNEQLPKLPSLYNVYTSTTDQSNNSDTLGQNPSLVDVANFLGGRIEQVRQGQGVIADVVAQNMKQVELHQRQLSWLHQNSVDKDREFGDKMQEVDRAIAKLNEERMRQYRTTCEMRQRSIKGNFILSGPDVPKFTPGEKIYDIVAKLVWDKYQVGLNWYQLRAMHRLPGNNIIFGVNTRMPGSIFQPLVTAVNTNPNPRISAYLNMQLTDPFDCLHYVARKLKSEKLISFYKLDENGFTWICHLYTSDAADE